jgi:outer membrane protein TolC
LHFLIQAEAQDKKPRATTRPDAQETATHGSSFGGDTTPTASAERFRESNLKQKEIEEASSSATTSLPQVAKLDLSQAAKLELPALEREVLARNPTLVEMTAAWQAAVARYPQAVALDDPMFTGAVGPGTIGTAQVDFAFSVQVSQRYPWWGKRALRGQQALAEAAAAGQDVIEVKLQLVEATHRAFYDYYLSERALTLNRENLQRWQEARQNAEARYKSGQVPQQDVLQAEVEIGRLQERELQLRRMQQVAKARLNALLHRSPEADLPPPAEPPLAAQTLPPVEQWQQFALQQRPDLQALYQRLTAEQAALALAEREFYPDMEVMAGYNSFMPERPVRPMVGLGWNLPIRRDRRLAAVREAQARVAQRRAQIERLIDQIRFEVQEAYEMLRESEQTQRLLARTILPAAEANVREARTAYTTGRIPFVTYVEAERQWIQWRERYYEVVAEVGRRRARLERVAGGPFDVSSPQFPDAISPSSPTPQ